LKELLIENILASIGIQIKIKTVLFNPKGETDILVTGEDDTEYLLQLNLEDLNSV